MLKNRLVFIFMVAVSFVSLGISGSRGSYIMLMAFLSLGALSAALALLSWLGLKVDQGLSQAMIMKNETGGLQVRIECRFFSLSILRIRLAKLPDSVILDFDSGERELFGKGPICISANVSSQYRGVYPIGIESIEVMDFLRIFRLVKKIPTTPVVIVCPRILPFSDELFLISPSEQSGASRKSTVEDYSSIADVRPFAHDDSMKRIHWKLSAKRNELMVKNYDVANTTATAVIVDNRATPDSAGPKYALEDMAIELAISIVDHNLNLNQPVILDYMDAGRPARLYETSAAGFDRAYYSCASILLQADGIEDLLSEYYNPGFTLAAVYVLTINPDKLIDDFVKAIALQGQDVNLIHFFEKAGGEQSGKYRETGVNYYGACLEKHENPAMAGEGLLEA